MDFEDKVIVCADCGTEFVHSAEDQARYAERGFTSDPKRCRPCREKRKAEQQSRPRGGGGQRGGGYGGGHGGGGYGGRSRRWDEGGRGGRGGPGGGRPRRESFEVVCSSCGEQTTVPFKPIEGRPVYCRDCYQARKG